MLTNYITLAALLATPFAAVNAYTVESIKGPVTKKDISSFKDGMKNLKPSDASANEWAQGHSGENTKALGLVYGISKDTEILDKMLTFCDKVLTIRNDKSPKGCNVWTGAKDPVWVDCKKGGKPQTGGEQGDPVGHLGNCARLILRTPSIWNKNVPDKDPHKFGRTYLQRAKTYVREADYAVDKHILKSLLDTSKNNRQHFAKNSPYKGGQPVPWNQQMMFNYGFYNLAIAHEILRDDAARASKYNALVQASVDWFFEITKGTKSKKGSTVYNWGYVAPKTSGEDSNHGSLDLAGFSRLYASKKYKLTADKLKPFAHTVLDNMIHGKGRYAGRVDGTDGQHHAASTKHLRSGYLLMAEFLPESLEKFTIDINPKSIVSPRVFSRLLWVKNRISKHKHNKPKTTTTAATTTSTAPVTGTATKTQPTSSAVTGSAAKAQTTTTRPSSSTSSPTSSQITSSATASATKK